jgi:hypothetical protein
MRTMNRRRERVPFDPYFFEKLGSEAGPTAEARFRLIYQTNHWAGAESVSGEGSGSRQTRILEEELPRLLERLAARVLLDLPCGDFAWMQHVRLPVARYIGADILPELVRRNQALFGNNERDFVRLDLTTDPLPAADVLLCRDALVHLSLHDAARALENVVRSEIRYLLTTTFPDCEANEDIATGDWRPLNLEAPPFRLPPPIRLINEGCTEGGGAFRDKSLGLWDLSRS